MGACFSGTGVVKDDWFEDKSERGIDGCCPGVFFAAKTGDLLRIQHLVACGADVSIPHPVHNLTPVYYACVAGHMEMVQYLLEVGGVVEWDCISDCHPRLKPWLLKVEECMSWVNTDIPSLRSLKEGKQAPGNLDCSSELSFSKLLTTSYDLDDTESSSSNKQTCWICGDGKSTYACAPCGHLCLCSQCINKITGLDGDHKCPLCRRKVSEVLRIYMIP